MPAVRACACVQNRRFRASRPCVGPVCSGRPCRKAVLLQGSFNVIGTEPARALRCLGSLTTLTNLVLNLRIPHFPRALCALPSLVTLTLRGAMRLRLPACITRLTQLTSLSLPSCGLRGIPPAICGIASAPRFHHDVPPWPLQHVQQGFCICMPLQVRANQNPAVHGAA